MSKHVEGHNITLAGTHGPHVALCYLVTMFKNLQIIENFGFYWSLNHFALSCISDMFSVSNYMNGHATFG